MESIEIVTAVAEDFTESADRGLRELSELQLLSVGGGIADPILA
jgi:hypothetical protein